MRIVITKNGRILIQEINPDIKFKSLFTNHKSFNTSKTFSKKIDFNSLKNNTYGNSTKNIFSPKKKIKNMEIDYVLSDFNSPKSRTKSLCKILNLEPNKHLNMPQSIAERYFSTQINSDSTDNEEKNILPDVLISINKSIEKEASKMGLDYLYDNISSLQSMKEQGNGNMIISNTEPDGHGKFTTNYSLPKILPAYPLKYIIPPKSINNLKKQAIKMENEFYKDKRLSEDNFRSKLKKDMKRTLTQSLKNEIKTENTNLITYLNKDKEIRVSFIERLSKFDDNRKRRLNKISQKTMFIQAQDKLLKERIKDKIRAEFRNTSEKYKEGLENIKNKLIKSETIINNEEKKIIDKKERYINQYNEAELYWVKSGALRFFHKNSPPINCATGLVVEK